MTALPSNNQVSLQVARRLLEAGCVEVRRDEPYRLPSGWASPVYMDCRRLISFPAIRRELVALSLDLLREHGAIGRIDAVAGAEASGIAMAAWIAEALNLPMQYVRKKPKGFGPATQVEGVMHAGDRVLLVDDVMAGGRSQAAFRQAIAGVGATMENALVIFDYGVFPTGALLDPLRVKVHALATWRDVLALARETAAFAPAALAELEEFLRDPVRWSHAHGGIPADAF